MELAPAYETVPLMAVRNRIGVRQAGVCVEGRGIMLTALMEGKAAMGDRLQSPQRRRPTRTIVGDSMPALGIGSGFGPARASMSQGEEKGRRTVQKARLGFDCGLLTSSPLHDPRQTEPHCPRPSSEAVDTALSTLKRSGEEEAVRASSSRHTALHRSADAKPQMVGVEKCESGLRGDEPCRPSPQTQQTSSSPDACATRSQPSPPPIGNSHGSVVSTLPTPLELQRNSREFEPTSRTSVSGSNSGAVSSREEITSRRGEEINYCKIIAAAGGNEDGQQREKMQHVPSQLTTDTTAEAYMNAMRLPSLASTTPPTTATPLQKSCGEYSEGDRSRSNASEGVSNGVEMEALARLGYEGLATDTLRQVTAGAAEETGDDAAMRGEDITSPHYCDGRLCFLKPL